LASRWEAAGFPLKSKKHPLAWKIDLAGVFGITPATGINRRPGRPGIY
jgi:hypothetical protein